MSICSGVWLDTLTHDHFFGRCVSSRIRSCSLSQSFPRAECKLLFLWKVFPTHLWNGMEDEENSPRTHIWASIRIQLCFKELPFFSFTLTLYQWDEESSRCPWTHLHRNMHTVFCRFCHLYTCPSWSYYSLWCGYLSWIGNLSAAVLTISPHHSK